MSRCVRFLKPVVDAGVTLVLWGYFIFGFLFFFSPVYAWVFLFSADRSRAFQRLNHLFFKSFVRLVRIVGPGLKIRLDKSLDRLAGCVVVANHRSYLDPVLLTAAFEKHSTIVKSAFFRTPVFGRVIRTAGYIPSDAANGFSDLLISRMQQFPVFFQKGGVVFIFPEGTRTRTGRLGEFNPGAFKIARRFEVPVEVLCISGTDRLFAPGRFLFHTCIQNHITIRRAGAIPADQVRQLSLKELMQKSREIMEAGLSDS
ncbi:MAG: 1-acyl-sn-glycerol-3-phosphate acyltransferase [Desulfobacteraceae bacterium]|nr:1-acyl-sn-glycerol-3-phosphate acyltransferase [Desulfobacteraceae bacterium]